MTLMENFPMEGSTVKDMNHLTFEYEAVPVFNDPIDEWNGEEDEKEEPTCDGDCPT